MRQARVEFFVKQPIMAWAGGAVSGLMLGGAASGINAAQQAQYNNYMNSLSEDEATQNYSDTIADAIAEQAMAAESGNENAAPEEDTAAASFLQTQKEENAAEGNKRLTDGDIDEYLKVGDRFHVRDMKAAMIENGESPLLTSEQEIRNFISESLRGARRNVIKGYARVGNRLAEALYAADQKINSKKTGGAALDINGYYMELEANHIAHLKDHVENDATALNEPLTFEETLQLPKYIDNFSDVLDVIRRKDGSIRFKLGAKINGYAIITEMVSKGRSSVHPVTAWKLPTSEYLRRYKNSGRSAVNASYTSNDAYYVGTNTDLAAETNITHQMQTVKAEPVRTLGEEMQRQMMQRGEADPSPYAGDPSAARQSRSAQDDSLTAESGGLRGLSLPTLEDGSGRKGSFGSPLLAQEDRVQGGMRNGQAETGRTEPAEVGRADNPSVTANAATAPFTQGSQGAEPDGGRAGGGAYARGDAGTPDGAVYGGDGGGRLADAEAGGAGALRGARGGSKDNTRLIQARQRAAAEQPLLSSAELGASAGTEARTLQVVPEGEWDADLRESADFAYANGINEFVPVVGMLTADTGSGAVEVLDIIDTGSGRMIIKADSVKRSVAEVVRHAVVHYAAGEQHVRAFMQEVQSRYRPEAWSRMYETYRARWAPLTGDYAGMTAEQTELYVWEEIMGDAYAGVNNYGTRASVYSAEARRAMGDAIRTVPADQSAAALAERAGAVAQENSAALRRDGEAAERYSIDRHFNRNYQKWIEAGKPNGRSIVFGTTSDALQSIGIDSRRIRMDTQKINKLQALHPYMTDEVMQQVPELLENPIVVMESRTQPNRVTMLGEVYVQDENGEDVPVMAVLELLPKSGGYELDDVKLVNAYARERNIPGSLSNERAPSRESTQWLIDNSEILYIEPDIKRTEAWLSHTGLQLPFDKSHFGSIGMVSYVHRDVNGNFSAKTAEPEVSPMQLAIQKGLEEKRQREKQRQLDVINRTNPAPNSYNTWVRSVEDIKTLAEAVREPEWDSDVYNEDWTREQALEAIEKDSVTLYSSQPIKNGVFVTPSRMEAKSYSGDGRVYTKTVSPDKVAWIDPTQGQYADTELRGLSLPTLEDTESTERFSVEDGESDNPAPYAGDPSAARQSRSAQDDSLTAESGGLRGLSLPTPESDELTDGSLRRAALAQGDSTPEASEAVRQAVRKVEPPEGYGTVSSYVADAMAREERGRAVRLEETAKEDFTGTEALEKLGVKIDRGVGIYQGIEQLRDIDRAAKQIERALKRAERRLEATEAERSFASGVAAGLYAEEDIPSRLDADKVMELADYYMAAESVKGDRIRERRRTIERINEEKMEKLFAEAEDEPDKTAKRLALIKMNYRTPERNMRHIFGDALGERINEAIFYPVQRNEAERFRFKQRMLDAVRAFEGEDGKRRRLSRAESALVQQLLEGDAARDEAERSA